MEFQLKIRVKVLFFYAQVYSLCFKFHFQTYNVDALTPDSAGTATAYLTGCKTNKGVIGGNDKVMKYNCSSTKGNNAESILHHAHKNGR